MAFNEIVEESDRLLLERVQSIRTTIINDLTVDGIPSNKDDRAFLLETMKDVDKSIMGKAKIKVADKTGEQNANSAKMIAEILSRHSARPNQVRNQLPVLDPSIVITDLVEGETTMGIDAINYDELLQS